MKPLYGAVVKLFSESAFEPNIESNMISHGQALMNKMILHFLPQAILYRIDARPAFMQGLEFDLYFPEHRVAFEFQGDQHYVTTEFGSPSAQKSRDRNKKTLSHFCGIRLMTVQAYELRPDLIVSKVRYAFRGKLSKRDRIKNIPQRARALHDAGNAYRQHLKERFPDSVTIHREGTMIREKKYERHHRSYV